MNASSLDPETYRQRCNQLIREQQTVLLATATTDGIPLNSYAPFVRDESGVFYVFLSELAEHTRNLINNPQASLLLMRAELETPNPFARERVNFGCSAQRIDRDSARFHSQIAALTERFGGIMQQLQLLADFHLFALSPQRGTYVAGFGKAFLINPESGAFTHITPERLIP